MRAQTGDLAASGPGVTVVAKPSTRGNLDGQITDHDLQILVNGLWYAGAERVDAGRAALYTAVLPVSALALAALVLHEPIGVRQLIGAACVLAAIAVSTVPGRRG